MLRGKNHIAYTSELKAKPLPRSRWLILHDSTGWLSAAALTFKYEIYDGADCVHWGASAISVRPSLPARLFCSDRHKTLFGERTQDFDCRNWLTVQF
jgi:hypothetical protein